PDENEPSVLRRNEERGRLIGDVVALRSGAASQPNAGDGGVILDHERHARERAVAERLRRALSGTVVSLVDNRIQRWIYCFDLADRILDGVTGRDLFGPDQLSQAHGIVR